MNEEMKRGGGSSGELPGAGVEWENEEEGVDEGWKGEEGSVLGPGGGEGEGRQRFWHAGSLCPPMDEAAIWATCPTRHSGRFILVRELSRRLSAD